MVCLQLPELNLACNEIFLSSKIGRAAGDPRCEEVLIELKAVIDTDQWSSVILRAYRGSIIFLWFN